jgi:tetratricopeptide (TPR) repeat protein
MKPPESPLLQALVQLGHDNLSTGNTQQALALFKEGVRLAPRDATCNHCAGQTALALGQAETALPYLEVAIQEAPMEEAHWVSYIHGLIAVGAIETAASAIEFGVKYGLGVATATQLATDFVKSQENRTPQPAAPEIDFWSLPPAPPWPDPPLSETADLSYITPPESKGRRYVIVSPVYRHNSAGIRVLYNLQQWLIRAGYDAIVINYLTGLDISQFADDIAIYPDVVSGNPLKCRRVVRYLLNHPGRIGGDLAFPPHELALAHSRDIAIHTKGAIFYIPSTEGFFINKGLDRTHDAFYIGKGKNLNVHPTDAIQITHAWPPKRAQLADFLNRTRNVYIYDDMTVVSYEAKLCGCNIFLIKNDGDIIPYPTPFERPLKDIKQQLHQFLVLTQSM